MSEPVFGWAVVSRHDHLMLPVLPTRVEAIAQFVSAIDETVPGPAPTMATALGIVQANAWRRAKWNYGVRVIRVRVEEAFGAHP